jgi:diguanylate cyclase (GGDEF)-like protein
MDGRYAGREIPEVLYKLLMPGWRNLLVNTHLREGEDSADWKKHVQTLDQVFQYVDADSDPTTSTDYMPPEELLKHIESGLDSISYEPGQRIPLINSLRQVITGKVPVSELPKIVLEQNTIAANLGFGDVSAQEETRRSLREQNEADTLWQRCFDRAQHLHVGAWVEFTPEQEPEISIVAWLNEDATRFVFVNQRGVKTHDISVEELATMIHLDQVRILEESDIPITERASHRMLQNMHNQLTHQATHDDLTGLINRKEFERELELALEAAKRNESINLCAYLDLDQFKVINNTGGHAAGDKLLVTIARLLEDNLRSFSAKVSRLGGDEFGLLVNDCDQEVGAALIKKISDSVKALRFEWEKDMFSLTTSFGLYYIHKDTDSVSKILRSADSSSIAAKEAGRDRIHVFQEDDSEMEHRKGIMEFVSQIDKALDEDRFVLNCQKIQPIDATDEDSHYEILLTVLDDDDTPLPPQDFIIAAEKFNRMGAVDRWVIRNAFKFISTNILKLDHLGAFSINISGNSLTEDDFMEFVLEQFNETRLPTSKVCFEITETAAVGSLDDVVEFMERMKIIGVSFSLDDFGTGLSSYSYLRNLPVDYLKIDGIFVKDIKDSPSDYAVVKSINEIGHFMGKKTIAEFVENDEILEILREIGVDYAQGWGIGKKMPITDLLK